MCIKQSYTWQLQGNGYRKVSRPCGHCWACLKNKTNDLVGRMLCEASTSEWVRVLTLTYGDDRIKAMNRDARRKDMIYKEDFQNFLKTLRKRGFKCRYAVAGEYGSRKARAHFHMVWFGSGMPPRIPLNTQKVYLRDADNPEILLWPWGFCYAEDAQGERPFRYVAKYAVKARDARMTRKETRHEEWVSYSRKPLLGHAFISQDGRRHGEARLLPQNFNYVPPGGDVRNRYSFYGKAQEVWFDAFLEVWPEAHFILDQLNYKAAKAERSRTAWVYNAWLRYKKIKAQAAFEALPGPEREQVLLAELGSHGAGLTGTYDTWFNLLQNSEVLSVMQELYPWLKEPSPEMIARSEARRPWRRARRTGPSLLHGL